MNQEKYKFIFGLIAGVIVAAVVGLIIVALLYVWKNYEIRFDDEPSTVQTGEKKDNTVKTTPKKAEIEITESDHVRGDEDAVVTIVEFSDIQCPYCSKFHKAMKQALESYSEKARWVYKHFPLDSIHPFARRAALASECAGEQGKFWEYLDNLFANQEDINGEYFLTSAESLDLNKKQFSECLESEKYADKVDADYRLGQGLGVRVTPTSFINGQEVRGALPVEQIKSIIESVE